MKRYEFRRTRSWNMPEHRPLPIGLAIVALALVGMQLAEVWQSARVAELSLRLDRSREALSQVQARVEHVRAEGAARTASSLNDFNGATVHLREAVGDLKEEVSRFTI
jgi:hypothetical protein